MVWISFHYTLSLVCRRPRKPWTDFVNSSNEHLVSEDVFDLLDGILQYSHRVSPYQALAMYVPPS